MDDALLVRGFERFGDLARDRQRLVQRQRPSRDPIGQRRAFDQFHHQRARSSRCFFESVDLGDVRVVQRREQLRLALEAREPIRIAGERLEAGS